VQLLQLSDGLEELVGRGVGLGRKELEAEGRRVVSKDVKNMHAPSTRWIPCDRLSEPTDASYSKSFGRTNPGSATCEANTFSAKK
jgi:hypothetical protein